MSQNSKDFKVITLFLMEENELTMIYSDNVALLYQRFLPFDIVKVAANTKLVLTSTVMLRKSARALIDFRIKLTLYMK